jgi:hypothetical protein
MLGGTWHTFGLEMTRKSCQVLIMSFAAVLLDIYFIKHMYRRYTVCLYRCTCTSTGKQTDELVPGSCCKLQGCLKIRSLRQESRIKRGRY